MVKTVKVNNLIEREVENLLEQELHAVEWKINVGNRYRNVYRQSPKTIEEKELLKGTFPDFMLYESNSSTRPIAIIETKKSKYSKLNNALQQAKEYAKKLETRFIFIYSKNIFYSYDIFNQKEMSIDGVNLQKIPSLELLHKFKHNKSADLKLTNILQINSRNELIKVFDYANKQLRTAGITIGLTRFTEFSNILFLKLISENSNNFIVSLPEHVKWDNYKNKEGQELLDYINNTVIPIIDRKFLNNDQESIFQRLNIKDTVALKKIIDKLSQLDLSNIKTDIKGDAFEYFIQKYNDTNKDMGEYFTPRHIVDFLVKIAEPKFTEKIYDIIMQKLIQFNYPKNCYV